MSGQPYVFAPWRSVTEVAREGFIVSGPWGTRSQDGVGRITLESEDNRRFVQLSEGEWLTSRDRNGEVVTLAHRYRIRRTWDEVAGTQRLEFDVQIRDSQFGDVFVSTLTPLAGMRNVAPESRRVGLRRSRGE